MLRLATRVAQDSTNSLALLTGDNLGQVASQTLKNMAVIDRATEMLVLRPLLSFEKLHIMEIAREIQTHDISVEPIPDSCTVFAPDDPCTSSYLDAIEAEEARIPVAELLEECLAASFFLNPNTLSKYPLVSGSAGDLSEEKDE